MYALSNYLPLLYTDAVKLLTQRKALSEDPNHSSHKDLYIKAIWENLGIHVHTIYIYIYIYIYIPDRLWTHGILVVTVDNMKVSILLEMKEMKVYFYRIHIYIFIYFSYFSSYLYGQLKWQKKHPAQMQTLQIYYYCKLDWKLPYSFS